MSNVVSLQAVKDKKKLEKETFKYDLRMVNDVFVFKHFLKKLTPEYQRYLVVFILNLNQKMADKSVFIPPLLSAIFYEHLTLSTSAVYFLFIYVSKLKDHDKHLVELKLHTYLENNNIP
jgi:hypothetical protein